MSSIKKNFFQRIKKSDVAILLAFLLLILIFLILTINSKEKSEDKVELTENSVTINIRCPHHIEDTLSLENLSDLLISSHMEHPEIVMAQIRLESGNLTSSLTKENNNFLGMKYPAQRPTTSIGKKNGFAEYNSWQDCLFDYLIWQSRYAKKLSVDEYYDYLKSTYAQDEDYIQKLKQIVNE